MIEKFALAVVGLTLSLGYLGIIFLMALESSFFPFPSEVVVPPAGFLAATGQMNIFMVIFCGILGSVIGALVNYYLAVRFGRAFLFRYGNYFFLGEDKLLKMENFFFSHGEITTFVGRLIPGVRQYISFPAGLARMSIAKFVFYTAAGAGIWVVILAYVGFYVGKNIDLVKEKLATITMIILPLLLLLVLIYIIVYRKYVKR